MQMGTPRSEQGQIVENSYGWKDGELYRRTFDHSDRSETWAKADKRSRDRVARSSYDAAGDVSPPRVACWIPCAGPDVEGR